MEELHDKKNIIEIHETIKKEVDIPKQLMGLVFYFIVFVVVLPTLLYKKKFFNFLESYLPNLDLVANILCWYSGSKGIWAELYPSTALSIYGFLSQSFVNYLALLGVTYIIARESNRKKNIMEAWTPALVMLLVTYLLPADFIRYSMDKASEKFSNRNLALIFGVGVTSLIILLESFIIRNSHQTLMKLGNFIIDFPNKF